MIDVIARYCAKYNHVATALRRLSRSAKSRMRAESPVPSNINATAAPYRKSHNTSQ